jgi:ACS family hexuronate transporter-like MFS transporter
MDKNKAARWGAVAFFALASTWNYLDRSVLSAAGPAVRAEFHLSNEGFGWLVSAFSLAYAVAAPATGWLLDRLGLETGIVWAVGLWSLAAAGCGWTRSVGQLAAARAVLGGLESTGVPAAGKLNSIYLEPKHRALGAAMTQVGIGLGMVAAPLLARNLAGWRTPFFVCAIAGLAWIPLWMLVRRLVPPYREVTPAPKPAGWNLPGAGRLLTLAAANILWMAGYTFWSNWTTLYLAQTYHLSPNQANGWAWIPPAASVLGGFAGGWMSSAAISRGMPAVRARILAILVSAVGCLVTMLAPWCPTPALATAVAALSYFFTLSGSVNLYTIPVDIWGGERAGSAISALVFAYGLLQTGISPLIGHLVDRFGYAPVCWLVALPPLAAWALLRDLGRRASPEPAAL